MPNALRAAPARGVAGAAPAYRLPSIAAYRLPNNTAYRLPYNAAYRLLPYNTAYRLLQHGVPPALHTA